MKVLLVIRNSSINLSNPYIALLMLQLFGDSNGFGSSMGHDFGDSGCLLCLC